MKNRALIFLIVLLAFALALYRLDAQALWWDESLSVYRATRDLATIFANTIVIQTVVTTDLQPPLYFAILHFLVPAVGISEFALRFFSVAAIVATVALIYALARHWFDARVARLAALLSALSPFYIWYAQEARPYALVLFFSTLAIYALTRAVEIGRGQTRTNADKNNFVRVHPRLSASNLWVVAYILATIASLYTHYYAIFLLPFHVALIAIQVLRDARQRAWIFLPALPGAAAIFLAPLVLRGAAGNVNSGPTIVALDVILRDLLNSFSVGITMDAAQAMWIDLALLVLFLIGILPNAKSENSNPSRITNYDLRFTLSLLAYLALPILALLAAQITRPLYQNSRYFIAISPAFYIGVAAGIATIARRGKIFALPALAIFLIGAFVSLNNLYFDPRWGKDDHRAWAMQLREQTRAGDLLILNSPHTEELFRYYARDLVPFITLPILRADGAPSSDADRAAVRDALSKSARVWYLEMHAPFDDPHARIAALLDQEGVMLDAENFRGTSTKISLAQFARALPVVNAAEIAHLRDILFDGHLRLRGYNAPVTIAPGARTTVTLFWEIDEPVGEDYAVSLRIVDDAGITRGQWDTIPLGNRAGSSTWMPKKIFAAPQTIQIARAIPPGYYQWRVAPYHSATGNALGEVITLGAVQVIP
ncbi:MAG: glycosyltransferase family 39 protein [Chloroflexi bacterium]|nr:glycosyltransferase family 39 protein [Chloroflexota bacterium]